MLLCMSFLAVVAGLLVLVEVVIRALPLLIVVTMLMVVFRYVARRRRRSAPLPPRGGMQAHERVAVARRVGPAGVHGVPTVGAGGGWSRPVIDAEVIDVEVVDSERRRG